MRSTFGGATVSPAYSQAAPEHQATRRFSLLGSLGLQVGSRQGVPAPSRGTVPTSVPAVGGTLLAVGVLGMPITIQEQKKPASPWSPAMAAVYVTNDESIAALMLS